MSSSLQDASSLGGGSDRLSKDMHQVETDIFKLISDVCQLIADVSIDIPYVISLLIGGCVLTYFLVKKFHNGHKEAVEDSIQFLESVRDHTSQARQQIIDLNKTHHEFMEEKNKKIAELETLLASRSNDTSTSLWGLSQTVAPVTLDVSKCANCVKLQISLDSQQSQLESMEEKVQEVTSAWEQQRKLSESSCTDENSKLLYNELASREQKLTRQSSELEELYGVISGLEEEIESLKVEASEVKTELSSNRSKIAADEETIEKLKKENLDVLDSSANKIENKEKDSKDLKDKLVAADAEVARLNHDLEVIADRNRAVEKELDVLKEEAMGHHLKHDNLNEDHLCLRNDHDQLEKELTEANKVLKEQESTMEEQEETMNGLEKEIEELRNVIEEAGLSLPSGGEAVKSSENSNAEKIDDPLVKELKRELEKLTENNATQSAEIEHCQQIASEQNDKIFKLTKELDLLKSELVDVKCNEEELHRLEKELQLKCETLENSLELERATMHGIDSDHKGEIEDLQKSIEDLQHKCSASEEEYKEKDTLIHSQMRTIEEQEDVMAQLQSELEQLKAEHTNGKEGSSTLVAQLSEQVESLNTAVSHLNEALKEREETCAQLNMELAGARKAKEDLDKLNEECAASFAHEKLVMEEKIFHLESQQTTTDAHDEEQSISNLVISSNLTELEEAMSHDEEKPSSKTSSPDKVTMKEELPPRSPATKSGWFPRLMPTSNDNDTDASSSTASAATTTTATTVTTTTTELSSASMLHNDETTMSVETSLSDDLHDLEEAKSTDYEAARKPRIQNLVVQSPKEKKSRTVETVVKKVKEDSVSAKVPIGWTNAGKLNRAALMIQRHFRGLMAVRQTNELKSAVPHSLAVEIVCAEDIPLNDDMLMSVPDTFVVATVSTKKHDGKQRCFSAAKTDIARGDVNPTYNQEISPSAFGSDYKLVFNVFSSHTIGADSLKGQAVLNVHSYNHLDNGKKHRFRLRLQSPTEAIYDASGNLVENIHVPSKITGELELNLSIPPIHRSCNGWFFRIKQSITGVRGKKVWAVLKEDNILCYDNPFCEKLFFVLNLPLALKIAPKSFILEKIEMTGIEITMEGVEPVYLAWGDDSNTVKGLWFQALRRFSASKAQIG